MAAAIHYRRAKDLLERLWRVDQALRDFRSGNVSISLAKGRDDTAAYEVKGGRIYWKTGPKRLAALLCELEGLKGGTNKKRGGAWTKSYESLFVIDGTGSWKSVAKEASRILGDGLDNEQMTATAKSQAERIWASFRNVIAQL